MTARTYRPIEPGGLKANMLMSATGRHADITLSLLVGALIPMDA